MEIKDFEVILRDQMNELRETDFSQFVTRKEEKELDLDSNLVQVVIGVRRCGKSTLCQKVLMESKRNFAYVNFDDENLANLNAEQLNDILKALYNLYGNFDCLFMDEIQNAPKWHLFVNRLLRQKLHLVITGSNANLLSSDLATHLTGRYNQIELFPFSFQEYCTAKGIDTKSLTTKASGLRLHALEQYMKQGGFPETLNMKNQRRYIMSLLEAILTKDICKRYKIRYKTTLRQIANATLDKFCQELSFASLKKDYQIKSIHTVKNYVSYLEEAYLLRILPRFAYKSLDRQTSRKCYAIDTAFVDDHEDALLTENLGWRLENIAAIELMRRMQYESEHLYYIKQPKSFEVDFALTDRNRVTELVQVTYDFRNPSKRLYNREIGGLLKGAALTKCNNLTLVMMYGETKDVVEEGKTVHCIEACDWLLQK